MLLRIIVFIILSVISIVLASNVIEAHPALFILVIAAIFCEYMIAFGGSSSNSGKEDDNDNSN